MRTLLVILLAIVACSISGQAAVVYVTNNNDDGVQAALDSASDGDTIQLACTTGTWDVNVDVDQGNGYIIRGCGAGNTVITLSGARLEITTTNGKVYRITGIEFQGATAGTDGAIDIQGTSRTTPVRVDHNYFNGLTTGHAVYVTGDNYLIADSNHYNLGNAPGFHMKQDQFKGVGIYGDNSYAQATNYGSGEAIFIEDSYVISGAADTKRNLTDMEDGSRTVVRYNYMIDSGLSSHGMESGGRGRGMRSAEIYSNYFDGTGISSRCFHLRSGTGLIYDNEFLGYNTSGCFTIDNNRQQEAFSPWGPCTDNATADDGLVDNPSAFSAVSGGTGTETSSNDCPTSCVMTDTGGSWSPTDLTPPNDGTGWYVIRNTTTGRASAIVSSTATAITYRQAVIGEANSLDFSGTDGYEIQKVAEGGCAGFVAMGQSDYISGATPSSGWINQIIEPWYEWDNTAPSNQADFGGHGVIFGSTNLYKEATEFSYTPYTYPHPQRSKEVGNGKVVF